MGMHPGILAYFFVGIQDSQRFVILCVQTCPNGGFDKYLSTNLNGCFTMDKTHLEMDDHWGYPYDSGNHQICLNIFFRGMCPVRVGQKPETDAHEISNESHRHKARASHALVKSVETFKIPWIFEINYIYLIIYICLL